MSFNNTPTLIINQCIKSVANSIMREVKDPIRYSVREFFDTTANFNVWVDVQTWRSVGRGVGDAVTVMIQTP